MELQVAHGSMSSVVKEQVRAQTRLVQTPERHVMDIAAEGLRHRAVCHPYLQALTDGALPDARWALRDFAEQYLGYSSYFPRYLATVISRLDDSGHRAALLQNLMEESGIYNDHELAELAMHGIQREWIDGFAHPLLFQRFAHAVGATHDKKRESDPVVCWREMFLQLLSFGTAAEAVGAIGLGTENIVSTIYRAFVTAIARQGDLSPQDTVFFPLHTTVDDHHQETLFAIAVSFARTAEGRVELRRGMLKALQLRSSFWDWMLERALCPERSHQVVGAHPELLSSRP